VSLATDPKPLTVSPADVEKAESRDSVRMRQWRVFWSTPLSYMGVGVLGFIIAFCFLGPLVWHGSTLPNVNLQVHPPMPGHPLGTDSLGRDELIRLMVGGQVSLIVGFASAVASMVIGTLYGMVSPIVGGWFDALLMRFVDVMYSIPTLFLLMLLSTLFSPSPFLLTVIIALTSWPPVTRLVRSEVLSIRQREYIEAANAMGASTWSTMVRHLLPNIMGVVLVTTTFQVGNAILTIVGLSFLGLGLPPPAPNWGYMLNEGMNYIFQNAWWMIYPPGLAIVLVELAVNFIGDAFRQAFDPRLLGA
jgi:peptide/nickel transport system permease protein